MHDARASQEDARVAVLLEAVLHLALLEIHEESGVEGSTFVKHLTGDEEVGAGDVVHRHPRVGQGGGDFAVEVQGFAQGE